MAYIDKYDVNCKKKYQEQLLTGEWQSRRREILRRDNYTCQECGTKAGEASMHVHHKGYVSSLLPWEYPDEALTTLCESCHSKAHERRVHTFVSVDALKYYIHSFDYKFNFDPEKMRDKWEEYKYDWCEFLWSEHPFVEIHHPIQCGTCLSAAEYSFYKKNKYNFEDIKAYSWSGKVAHEVMLNWRLKEQCEYDLKDDNSWEFHSKYSKREYKYNYYAPGYYKVIYIYGDIIGTFYSAENPEEFFTEEIILPRHSLDNSQPETIHLGDVILIKRCELINYNHYEIDWLNWSRHKELDELQAELSRYQRIYDNAIDSNSQWMVEYQSGADRSSSVPPHPEDALNGLLSEIERLNREIKVKIHELVN